MVAAVSFLHLVMVTCGLNIPIWTPVGKTSVRSLLLSGDKLGFYHLPTLSYHRHKLESQKLWSLVFNIMALILNTAVE